MTVNYRVLVVADDPLARAGLANLLELDSSVEVVARTDIGDGLDASIEAYTPEVVVLDAGWDSEDAIELLGDRDTSVRWIVLVPDDSRAVDAFTSGADAMLLRDSSSEMLTAAIRAVTENLRVISPQIADVITSPEPRPQTSESPELTRREMEVLRLVAEGQSNKEIAFNLDISDHTVKFHVNSILTKLSARSRTEAVTQAARLGLLYL